MGLTLANTSWSVNIKERLDLSCAIFNETGDLVANAPSEPVHLGLMSDSIRTVMRENASDIHPGDAFALNSPFNGGTHLPDVTVMTPVFVGDHIAFWLGSRGHHADIGGRSPGSAPPDSTHIDEEGVLIENLRLVNRGVLKEEKAVNVLSSGQYPCRNIPQNMADLKAQIAANEIGRKELLRVVENYGLDVVQAYMGHVQDNAEESVRQVIGRLKDGSFNYPMDHGAVISGNTEVSQATCNALYGALGVIACSQATMNNFDWGNDGFQNYETIAGGTGAGV